MKRVDGIKIRKEAEPKKEASFKLPREEDLIKTAASTKGEAGAPASTGSGMRGKKQKHLNIGGHQHIFGFKNILLSLIIILVLAILIILTRQAIMTRNELLNLQDNLEKNFSIIEDFSGGGNLEQSLSEISKMQGDLSRSKLIAQAWGQDMSYFQYLPGQKSSLTEKELLLDSGYDISYFSDDLKGSLGGIKKAGNQIDFTLLSNNLSAVIRDFNKKIAHYRYALKGTDSSQSTKIEGNLETLQDKITGVNDFLVKDLPWLSGSDGADKNIMIIFQNNGELRGGSGGSLGSFGILKFSGGSLNDIIFGQNIYKIDQAFKARTHIDSPEVIQFLTRDWVLKDAGWSTDGPTAFATIEDFYTKETGAKVDGVISLDATFFEMLLDKIGPINLPKYGKSIDSKNFRTEIEQEVHNTYFDRTGSMEENEPKKILAEMIPLTLDKIFDSLSDKEKAVGLLGAVNIGLVEKHILLYFNDQHFQNLIEQSNWSGTVKHSIGDYLYINNSNIAGGKSSVNIDEALNLDVTVESDGTVANKLSINRSYVSRDGTDNNVNFIRLGLPEGTKVDSFSPVSGNFQQFWAKGYKNGQVFWPTDEFSKSWVNFWMSTPSNEKSQADISYTSNYKITVVDNFAYQLLIQKQPGSLSDTVTLVIHYPVGYKPTNIKNYDKKNHSAKIKLNLKGDLNIKIKFEKE